MVALYRPTRKSEPAAFYMVLKDIVAYYMVDAFNHLSLELVLYTVLALYNYGGWGLGAHSGDME
jgi:hypothetical protein